MNKAQKLFAKMYEQTQGSAGGQAGPDMERRSSRSRSRKQAMLMM